jgi:hypothetical protein
MVNLPGKILDCDDTYLRLETTNLDDQPVIIMLPLELYGFNRHEMSRRIGENIVFELADEIACAENLA